MICVVQLKIRVAFRRNSKCEIFQHKKEEDKIHSLNSDLALNLFIF